MILISLEPSVPPKLPPHVVQVRNKVGRPYLYLMRYRGTARAEKAQRLPDDHRTPEFWAEYARLMNLPIAPARNTVKSLDEAWGGPLQKNAQGVYDERSASPEWKQLSQATKKDWRRYRQRIVDAWGDLEVRGIEPKHVLALRDQYADTPASANNLLRCLSSMMSWCVPRGWRSDNPCREVKPLKGGDGYEPWTWAIIDEAAASLRRDLWWVVALALYTGQREDDVLRMAKSKIRGKLIGVRQKKTGKTLFIPMHRDLQPILAEALAASPDTCVTILTNTKGQPWTVDGFRASWGKNRPAAVLKNNLVFHGLRKSAVVTLLEAGCTTAQVQAITGQSLEMVEHYAKQVNQTKLAAEAIRLWENNGSTVNANTVANTVTKK